MGEGNVPIPPLASDLLTYFYPIASISGAVRGLPDCTVPPLSLNGICDTTSPPYERAAALIVELTLEEKVNSSVYCLPAVERLNLPPFNLWNEALHGVAYGLGTNFSDAGDFSHATSFPLPILTAAAFDDELVYSVADVISTELRAYGNAGRAGLDVWTPNVNPFRDPRWGRGQGNTPQTPGEDAFRVSQYAAAFIAGLQGPADAKTKKVIATCKHAAGNDLEDAPGGITRYNLDAKISVQDQADYYLRPFETCARDAGVGSLMCAYNAANGVPQCADKWLMQDLIRDYWGWNDPAQYITSDCFALDVIYNATEGHNYTQTPEQTASDSLRAGTDTECGVFRLQFLPGALREDPTLEKNLNRSLNRVYAALVSLGYFDPPEEQPYRSISWDAVNTPEAQELARKAATSGMILLKNRNRALPLHVAAKKRLSIALVGDWANATLQMQGNYHGPAPYLVSPLDALSKEPGVTLKPAVGLDVEEALKVAKASDVVIFIGGIDGTDEAEMTDRTTLAWNTTQREMISSLSCLRKKLIIVQTGGGQLDDSAWLDDDGVSAILWAGYPGQSGGQAIADILFGRDAPAGRLPVTQYPATYVSVPQTVMALRPDNQTNNPGQTYQWYTGEPVLPFGYGLHYTTFDVSVESCRRGPKVYDLSSVVKKCRASGVKHLDQCPLDQFSITVKNKGDAKSDYVALAFASGSYGPAPHHNKVLVAYQRVHDIGPRQQREATLQVKLAQLARFDPQGRRILYPGNYHIGIDTTPEKASFEFTLTGEAQVLETWPDYDRQAPI